MNKKELTGAKLKRDLKLKSCQYRWHNKNNSGGNFGINLYDENNVGYEICGNYTNDGTLYGLTTGTVYHGLIRIPKETDYNELIKIVKTVMSENRKRMIVDGLKEKEVEYLF